MFFAVIRDRHATPRTSLRDSSDSFRRIHQYLCTNGQWHAPRDSDFDTPQLFPTEAAALEAIEDSLIVLFDSEEAVAVHQDAPEVGVIQ